ncbi:hypothetical protein JQX13_45975 [Archangium violaceum]|uniref:hypothetical protein n=1 Tax=Archangium violaceum TaxID=83451 RepID=UPI00193BAA2C|nr:hypothetical protein [Archangium violaceum]QRK07313.1 hypothetical protein JQX13_45975 [Archangium violaceum]
MARRATVPPARTSEVREVREGASLWGALEAERSSRVMKTGVFSPSASVTLVACPA